MSVLVSSSPAPPSSVALGKRKIIDRIPAKRTSQYYIVTQRVAEVGSDSEYDSDDSKATLSEDDEQELDDTSGSSSSRSPSSKGPHSQPRTKNHACSYDGCTKAYVKPSRLKEHERSHTGQVITLPPLSHTQELTPAPRSAHTPVLHAQNPTSANPTSKPMPAPTFLPLLAPLIVPLRHARKGFGRRSMLKLMYAVYMRV